MNSIRPLVTITILVVAGVFLYVKINEGPVKSGAANEAWQNLPPDAVPPLSATAGNTPATSGLAPASPATVSAPTSAAAPLASSTPPPAAATPQPTSAEASPSGGTANVKLPAVPEIPELPDLPRAAEAAATAQSSAAPPTSLPENIPTARYPDQPAPSATPAQPLATTNEPAAATPESVASSNSPSPSATAPSEPPLVPVAPAPPLGNPLEVAASNSAPATSETEPVNPLRQPEAQSQPLAQPDRYAIDPSSSNPPAAETTPIAPAPAASTFASTWPAIQAALDRGELARAHQMLSPFHNDPALTPAESQRVETLLGQLAGTVVYSTEHQLGPARVVKPGETLETIAKECNVPWQLLAKINGVAAADQIKPGQELKVVKGPFSALVDLRRNEMTLTVDGRYAGAFPVKAATGSQISDGNWIVAQKQMPPAQQAVTPASYNAGPGGGRTLVLQADSAGGAPTGATLKISSASSSTDPTTLQVSPQDAEELSDILSIGSRVVVRR
jgi:LysM repeat protein